MNKIVPELINIFQIRVYRSIINSTKEYIKSPINPISFRVGFSQESSFNFEQNNIRIRLNIIIEGINEKDEQIGIDGEFGFEFHIHVENLSDLIEERDGSKKISKNLGITLMSIVYATARGQVFERTQGTYLNGVVLPVIDPHDILFPPTKNRTENPL